MIVIDLINIKVIKKKILLVLACFFFFQAHIANAIKDKEDRTLLEADYIKKNDNIFFANGHVILKNNKTLINADEVVVNKKKNNNENHEFHFKNWVKIRTDSNNILFAKSMLYDEEKKNGIIKNAQIYPGTGEHQEVYATKLEKQDNVYILDDVSICPCKILTDDNVNSNRKQRFEKIDNEDELLEKPIEKNSIDNTGNEMHKKIQSSFMSFKMGKMIYNGNDNTITFKRFYLRLLGLPVLYVPSFSFHSDDSGDNGILLPQIIPIGKRQLGFEIPLYFKIRKNMDVLISRTQYIDLMNDKKKDLINSGNAYKLKDLSRYRESSTQVRFRHLLSNKYSNENFYRIDAMLTDRTQLVDNRTSLGKINENGDKIMGYRWMVDFRTRMKLTNTTFLKADINLTSDKNLMYYYRFDFRQIQENKIHLYDVTENRYFSAEIFNYQSRLIYLDPKTNPTVFPVLRGEFDFKKDKLGGNFYIRSKAYYINRQEGFDSSVFGTDIGYHLPFFTKFGTKITFDAMGRGIGNYFSYSQYTSDVKYDNYGGLLNGNYYASSKYYRDNLLTSTFKYNLLGFGKLQVEHPMIIRSLFGKTIFNPKFALRLAGNNIKDFRAPIDDNIAMQMNYYNSFELVQSTGFGVYDRGKSAVYGFDFKHQVSKNIEIYGGVSQNIRLDRSVQEEFLAEYTGFRRTISDVFAHFGAKVYNFSANGFLNYDNRNNEPRMLGMSANYSNKYTFVSVQYNSFSKNATIFNESIGLLTFNMRFEPTKKLKIIATTMYNFKNSDHNNKINKGSLTMYNVGAYYTISCLTIGLTVSRTNFVITNTPSDTIIRVKFAFAGF